MKMTSTEQSVMNSRVRHWFQEHYEFAVLQRQLRRSGVDLRGKVLLDAGCGAGANVRLLQRAFSPEAIYGIDLLPEEVALAQRNAPGAHITVGDLAATGFPDAHFDAVFAFGVFHHIPHWPTALQEVRRILKPDGLLAGGEIRQVRAVDFTWTGFVQDVQAAGFKMLESQKIYFGYFYSYLCVTSDGIGTS